MARLPRLAFTGHAHVLLLRAARPVFIDDADRRAFMFALDEAARIEQVALHGYSLRDHEVRLLATPRVDGALSRLMQALGRRYGAAFNRRYGMAGSLWAGRFAASAVEPDGWVLRCLLFVEGSVEHWSSAAHHLGRARDLAVTEHSAYWALGNTPFEREAAWARLNEHALTDEEVRGFDAAVRRGWPIGGDRFKALLAAHAGRNMAPLPVGRPHRYVP